MELIAPKGLGDALYLRAIVIHLLSKREHATVYTTWPEVFEDLPVTIRNRSQMDEAKDLRPAAYSRKSFGHLGCDEPVDQFSRACLRAGFTEKISLSIFWKVHNSDLLDKVRKLARGRRIMVYQPVKLSKNLHQELLRPDVGSFNAFVTRSESFFRIKVGHPSFMTPEAKDAPCDLDLVGRASVHDVFDVASITDTFFCEPCFLVVLAEAMDKPFTCMFSRRGIESDIGKVSAINPARLFNKPHLATAIYDDALH